MIYKFEFDKGENWRYEDLYAPFDFAILKNKDSIEAERKQLQHNSPLYFSVDTSVKSQVLVSISSELDESIAAGNVSAGKADEIKAAADKIIHEIYQRGIIKPIPEVNPNELFFIAEGKLIKKISDEDVFTLETAAGFIEKKSFNKNDSLDNFIKSVLSKSFRANIFYDEKLTAAFRQ